MYRDTLFPTSDEINARFEYIIKHPEEETEADKLMFRLEYKDFRDISDDYDVNDFDDEYEEEDDED